MFWPRANENRITIDTKIELVNYWNYIYLGLPNWKTISVVSVELHISHLPCTTQSFFFQTLNWVLKMICGFLFPYFLVEILFLFYAYYSNSILFSEFIFPWLLYFFHLLLLFILLACANCVIKNINKKKGNDTEMKEKTSVQLYVCVCKICHLQSIPFKFLRGVFFFFLHFSNSLSVLFLSLLFWVESSYVCMSSISKIAIKIVFRSSLNITRKNLNIFFSFFFFVWIDTRLRFWYGPVLFNHIKLKRLKIWIRPCH